MWCLPLEFEFSPNISPKDSVKARLLRLLGRPALASAQLHGCRGFPDVYTTGVMGESGGEPQANSDAWRFRRTRGGSGEP